ncbi:MAG: nucleotidyltransferase family protein [Prolixibacteraceae bacterium]|nr:nucleotidyltransferase family protein [Prolixibacteraceae bacterium]
MKAIVFAAGHGTRLRPLTNNCPKALIEIKGKPLIGHTLQNLSKYGVNEVIVNVHHFSEMVISYLEKTDTGIDVTISDERDCLLDTGGGLLKAKGFFNDGNPFFAVNVDIISTVNLNDVMAFHNKTNALATLVVRNRQTTRYFMFDRSNQLTGWKNNMTGEEIISRDGFKNSVPLAFSGIQVISPAIFDMITEKGKFSLTPLYLRLAKENSIIGYEDRSPFWIDVGKPGKIQEAEKWIMESS